MKIIGRLRCTTINIDILELDGTHGQLAIDNRGRPGGDVGNRSADKNHVNKCCVMGLGAQYLYIYQ